MANKTPQKRNPADQIEKEYMNSISEKTFTPRHFWQTCECCHQQYRRIKMFRITKRYLNFSMEHTYVGCNSCFTDIKEFRKWLEDNQDLLSKDDFAFMKDIQHRMSQNDPTLTKQELLKYTNLLWN